MTFNCEVCDSNFQQRRNLQQHQREHHPSNVVVDAGCSLSNSPSTVIEAVGLLTLFLLRKALNGYARSYQIQSSEEQLDPASYFEQSYGIINALMGNLFAEWKHGLKMLMSLHIRFVRATDETETITAHFNSSQRIVLQGSDIGSELEDGLKQMFDRIDKFTLKGSGWSIEKILYLDLNIAKFQVMRRSCGNKKLPAYVQKKKAVVSIKSNDNRCFMWSILACVYPQDKHSERYSKYVPFIKNFNFDCISYPVKLKDVRVFELNNDISINIFGLEYGEKKGANSKTNDSGKMELYPLYISKTASSNECDLLPHDGHYSCIRSLDRLLRDQINNEHTKFYCRRCLTHYYTEDALDEHKQGCLRNDPARTIMPSDKDKVLKFKNIARMQKSPLTVYADFECILKPLEIDQNETDGSSFTHKYQKHIPCGYGLMTILDCGCEGSIKKIGEPIVYRGPDAVDQFLKKLQTSATPMSKRLVILYI